MLEWSTSLGASGISAFTKRPYGRGFERSTGMLTAILMVASAILGAVWVVIKLAKGFLK